MSPLSPEYGPLFSVVVLNWNGLHHLPECLSSLRRQQFSSFEVVLVDNGSTDGSVPYVKENFPEVTLLELLCNVGFAAGVNAGIKASSGHWVVLLNNDTETAPDWLASLAGAVAGHPDIAIFASKLLNYYRRDLVDSAGDELDLLKGPYKVGEGLPAEFFAEPRLIFGACGGGGCYARALFEDIGLFDADFFAYFEDSDLSFRANWAGYRCLFVPGAVIYHKVGGTSDSGQTRRDRFDIMRRRNFIFLVVKNYPASFLMRALPYILTTHCLVFLANLLRGRFRVAFVTQWQILKGLPTMWKRRRAVLAARRITDQAMLSRCVSRETGWGPVKRTPGTVL